MLESKASVVKHFNKLNTNIIQNGPAEVSQVVHDQFCLIQGENLTIARKFRQGGVGEFTILNNMVKVQTYV